tara:strand:+ start:2802 stop:3125 length:324 start_codon:yes stop_codon:yes gene_type:complete
MTDIKKKPYINVDQIEDDKFYAPCELPKFNISSRTAANWRKIERKINGIKPAEKYKNKYEMIIDEKKKMKIFIGPKWKRKGAKHIVIQGKDLRIFIIREEEIRKNDY